MAAPNLVLDDRRPGLQMKLEGSDLTGHAALFGIGVRRLTFTTIAIRGERLALSRVLVAGRVGSFETETLQVEEVDEQGRRLARVAFEPDDYRSGFDELNKRYVEGEASEFAEVFRTITHLWDPRLEITARVALLDPNVVAIDHRTASFGTLGVEQVTRYLTEQNASIVGGWRGGTIAFHRLDESGAVLQTAGVGVTADGASVEFGSILLHRVEQGRITHMEAWPDTELDAALARYDALDAERKPSLQNACTRLRERQMDAFRRRDWSAYDELLAPDVITEDRRPLFRAVARGRAATVAAEQAIAATGVVDVATEWIAIRGERLSLARHVVSGSQYEVEFLCLAEIDDEGRGAFHVVFEMDDLDDAFDELDERFMRDQ
jgi:ketosteroid isomerase-like protein